MNKSLFLSKSKAFSIHFCISLLIFLALLYLILYDWYPLPFFKTDGGWQGIRLIVFVDLVLGPALTFVAFNPDKAVSVLKKDLSIIAIFQVIALTYGTWAVYTERPYLAVFSDGTFYPLAYYQIKDTGLSKDDLKKFDTTSVPLKIFADIPKEQSKRFALFQKTIKHGTSFHFLGELYRPLNQERLQAMSKYSIDMNHYLSDHPQHKIIYDRYILQHPETKAMMFFPLSGRYGRYITIFDNKTMEFYDVLDIPPPSIDEEVWGKEEYNKRKKRINNKKD